MASTPPVVSWMNLDDSGNLVQATLWDAGIVEAGSTSKEFEFYVWNNYNGSSVVSDMINVRISVRDENGEDVDKRICGEDTDTDKQASVNMMLFDAQQNSGAGDWGTFDDALVWQSNVSVALTAATPQFINQCSGVTAVTSHGGTVSGKDNAGDLVQNTDNYVHLKLSLTAKGSADAGTIKWITRVSYQYT